MKKTLIVLFLTITVLVLAACGKNNSIHEYEYEYEYEILSSEEKAVDTFTTFVETTTTVEIPIVTVSLEPREVLIAAELSEALIDTYFQITDFLGIPLSATDFVKLAELNYANLVYYIDSDYYKSLTVDEYISMINRFENNGLAQREIERYSSFKDSHSVNEYIQVVNNMKDSQLTEYEID